MNESSTVGRTEVAPCAEELLDFPLKLTHIDQINSDRTENCEKELDYVYIR